MQKICFSWALNAVQIHIFLTWWLLCWCLITAQFNVTVLFRLARAATSDIQIAGLRQRDCSCHGDLRHVLSHSSTLPQGILEYCGCQAMTVNLSFLYPLDTLQGMKRDRQIRHKIVYIWNVSSDDLKFQRSHRHSKRDRNWFFVL